MTLATKMWVTSPISIGGGAWSLPYGTDTTGRS